MTESAKTEAGKYILDYVKIYKLNQPEQFIDIGPLIHFWTLTESMNNGFIHGEMQIYDSVSLLDQFLDENVGWLKGEEEIEISYTDFFENNRIEKYFVYKVSDVESIKQANETIYKYKLYFVSKEKLYTELDGIRKSYSNNRISTFVEQVFNTYFQSEKEIEIETTSGYHTLVVPSYSPIETMNFFARKAISEENPSHTFRFFETRDKFHFTTHEKLINDWWQREAQQQQTDTYRKREFQDQTPKGQQELMRTLLDIQYPDHINTFKDINEGGYYRQTNELDYLNRAFIPNEYRHLDNYQKNRYPDQKVRSKHTKDFVDQYMVNTKDVLVIKDYSDTAVYPYMRKNTFYPEIYNEKNVNLYHHKNEMIQIKIYGQNKYTVGNLLKLDLYDIHFALEDRLLDKERSGYYLIEKIEHIFFEDQYIQKMSISKSGFQGTPEPADTQYQSQTDNQYTETGNKGADGDTKKPSQAGKPPANPGSKSFDELEQIALDAGFTPEEARIMAAIALAESSGNPSALNDNPGTGDLSYGLWQINMIGNLGPGRLNQFGISSYDELYNPTVNARAARSLYVARGGFEDWSQYNNGAYKKYLQ